MTDLLTGGTPIYHLPWPESGDPPDGPVQIRALAEATEAAIQPIDARVAALQAALPNLPWFRAPIAGGPVAAAGTNRLGFSASVNNLAPAHLSGANAIIIDTPGSYFAFLNLNTTNTGTIATGAYLNSQFQSPYGTPLNSWNTPMFGSGPLTVAMFFPTTSLPAGREFGVSITNNSTQTQTVVSGSLLLVRLSP